MDNTNFIKVLYKYGADLNAQNINGLTPMHIAAYANMKFQLTFLYKRGCDIDCPDNLGNTPLHWAIFTYDSYD